MFNVSIASVYCVMLKKTLEILVRCGLLPIYQITGKQFASCQDNTADEAQMVEQSYIFNVDVSGDKSGSSATQGLTSGGGNKALPPRPPTRRGRNDPAARLGVPLLTVSHSLLASMSSY